VDNFALKQSSRDIQALLGGFSQQWKKFIDTMKLLGDRMESANKAYQDMIGTRTRMLDKQVRQIDNLNKEKNIAPRIAGENDSLPELE